MLPEKDSDAFHIVVLCSIINISGVILLFILLYFLKDPISSIFNIEEISSWMMLLPISIFLEGSIQPIRTLLGRFQRFKIISYARGTQALVTGIVSLLLGYTGIGAIGLLIGFLAGQFIYSGIFFVTFIQHKSQHQITLSFPILFSLGKMYRSFPKYAVMASWLNTSSRQLPFFILASYFGSEVVGLYAIAQKVLFTPMSMISNSVSQVFFQASARAYEKGQQYLAKLTWDVFKYLLLLIIVPVLVLLFFAPPIFSFVFGKEWLVSGEFVQWMAPWLLVMFISSPLSYLVDVKNKLTYHFVYNILLFIGRFAALLVGGILLNSTSSVALYAMTGTGLVTLYLIFLLQIGGVFQRANK